PNWSIDRMVKNSQHVGALTQWMATYDNTRKTILLENSLTGSLSTDNQRVYLVEDFTVPPFSQNVAYGRPGVGSGLEQKLNDALHHNRLQAYELDSGKLPREVGGKSEGDKPRG